MTTGESTAQITAEGIWLAEPPSEPVMVHFDDRYLWSFTPARDGRAKGGGTFVPWPGNLVRFLDGVVQIRLQDVEGEQVWWDAEHRFGTSTERVAVVDKSGAPLSVDKVGHLGRAFLETPDEIKQELLQATVEVLTVLREKCGADAYLCYGALLGAVRDGHMIGHDSDVDVCYYSHQATPVDIILESYRIEAVVRAEGWTVTRMSGGDIKVVRGLSNGAKCHIDIFGAFTVAGTFYQLGNRSGDFDAAAHLLPLGTVTLEGVEFPAPKDPEAMLAFIYGPHWRVPDPSFVHRDNPHGVTRLNGWLRGFRTDLPAWNDVYDQRAGEIRRTPSDFAEWVGAQIAPGDNVADLGAGTGRDTRWFVDQGHAVRAVDFSRRSFARTRRIEGVRSDQTMFNELRRVLVLGARLARNPHHLYGRQLLGCLDAAARANLFKVGAMSLRNGHAMFLEFSAVAEGAPRPDPGHLVARLDPAQVAAEIAASGGRIDYLETAPGVDMFDGPDPAVCRMRITWPHPKESD
ncbi:class I SAM-dependent methyltransferase [Nocardioides sp. CER19]|uniref:class I SAM-dependent methyltransferase n=1 Tax=Nocardioides sp. CER19 TaxID=3038538 RepID=UPI00244C9A0D|nr:class I SAM-dependent methyltransferase [Nocardioides sp. CER19]MDH2414786.1 class I SAM-dependent methyltransferase [Nocardioides sp. CER19]